MSEEATGHRKEGCARSIKLSPRSTDFGEVQAILFLPGVENNGPENLREEL